MGSGMTKYSNNDTYYKKRKRTRDLKNLFSKEYSEYWKAGARKKNGDNFIIERNEFSFSSSGVYASPLQDIRRQSQFVSSFSKDESSGRSSGYMPSNSNNFSQNIRFRKQDAGLLTIQFTIRFFVCHYVEFSRSEIPFPKSLMSTRLLSSIVISHCDITLNLFFLIISIGFKILYNLRIT